jgi:hypothetical protein
MKTMIAALAIVFLAAGPTFAAGSHTRHLQEGRASAYVPQFASYADTSREGMVHAF